MIASGWNETERVARGRRAMTRSGMARPLQRSIRRTVFRGPTGYARSPLSANGITTEKAFRRRNGDCIRDGARAGSCGVRVLRPNGFTHLYRGKSLGHVMAHELGHLLLPQVPALVNRSY